MPEHLGDNRWRLLEGECVQDDTDPDKRIEGRKTVRVNNLKIDGVRHVSIQSGATFAVVKADSFEEAVAKCK